MMIRVSIRFKAMSMPKWRFLKTDRMRQRHTQGEKAHAEEKAHGVGRIHDEMKGPRSA